MDETNFEQGGILQSSLKTQFTAVTSLSKYLAMALFIAMPFIGGWIGYIYAPEKIIEVPVAVKMQDGIEQVYKENVISETLPNSVNTDISNAYISSTYRVVAVVQVPSEFREGSYESLVIATPRLENDYTCGGKFAEKCYFFLDSSFPGVESKFVGTWRYLGGPTLDTETIKFISPTVIEFSANGDSHDSSIESLWHYDLATASSTLVSEKIITAE